MNRENTCCFTGHRHFSVNQIEHIVKRLNQEIDNLIDQGVTHFISGGALGFDQTAASLIVAKKEIGKPIHLVFALPCRDQDALWSAEQKRLYRHLLVEADEIAYVLDEYHDGSMKKRNRFMVDCSAYCISALLQSNSGTEQMVRYARMKGLKISNIIKVNR